jgi:hypothetical protein
MLSLRCVFCEVCTLSAVGYKGRRLREEMSEKVMIDLSKRNAGCEKVFTA